MTARNAPASSSNAGLSNAREGAAAPLPAYAAAAAPESVLFIATPRGKQLYDALANRLQASIPAFGGMFTMDRTRRHLHHGRLRTRGAAELRVPMGAAGMPFAAVAKRLSDIAQQGIAYNESVSAVVMQIISYPAVPTPRRDLGIRARRDSAAWGHASSSTPSMASIMTSASTPGRGAKRPRAELQPATAAGAGHCTLTMHSKLRPSPATPAAGLLPHPHSRPTRLSRRGTSRPC